MPTLHSLVPCNSSVSKLILKKTAKDQGCLGIKGATFPLLSCQKCSTVHVFALLSAGVPYFCTQAFFSEFVQGRHFIYIAFV